MRDIKINKNTICNIALIFSFILCMLSICQIRMRMFWIYILILIIAASKKNRTIVILCGCFCCIILLSYYYLTANYLDRFRFPILEPFYEADAKAILKDEKVSEGEYTRHTVGDRGSCIFLSYSHEYHIYRDNDITTIYLPVQRNLLHSYGYAYCENEFDVDAPAYSLRNEEVLAIENYDWVEILNEHWAYVKVF